VSVITNLSTKTTFSTERNINMFYRILSHPNQRGNIYVSHDFNSIYAQDNTSSININAGSKTIKVNLVLVSDLGKDEIKISVDVLNYLSIPTNLLYQIKTDKENITIGPVIGLLMAKENSKLTEKKLDNQLIYTELYESFKGLLYVFSFEDIDFKESLIEGYYYEPNYYDKKGYWKKGVFPFPSAIYNRILLSKVKEKKLKEALGNKIFNSSRFNKLDFYNMSTNCEKVRKHLPETRLFSSMDEIDEMLQSYDAIYLKPINGTLAKGLIKVSKEGYNYLFRINENPNAVVIGDKKIAINYFNRIKYGKQYLIQQGINTLNFEGRHTDFRVIMQKDEKMQWQCTAIVARLGKEEGICSNFVSYGYALSFEEVFSRFSEISNEDILVKKNEVINVCTETCEMLDNTGENYGDFGIDVAIDTDYDVWIIEVNNRHAHNIVIPLNDEKLFYEIKRNPIKYAVALSGFNIVYKS
jgi:hypothetical protein